MANEPFSDEQKQFLSGFTFGADVARAVSGLPIISGSSASATVGGTASTKLPEPEADAAASGPDRLALIAQRETVAKGGKLVKEELAKQSKNPLDMWDEIKARSDAGQFPKGNDAFLTKFHGLFYVAPAQDSFMCRMRLPGGLIHGWQFRGLADLADRSAGPYLDVTTRANLQYREIPADQAMEILYGLRELDVIPLGSGGDNIRNCTASSLSGIDDCELIETIPLAKRMHHSILNHREMYGLPRKFNIAFDGGGRISALDDTNDIGFHAVTVDSSKASDDLPAGVYFQLTLGGITGHKDFARPTGVLLRPDECVDVAGAIVRVFVSSGDRTDRKKARLKYVLDDWGFDKFIEAVQADLGRTLRRVDEDRIVVPNQEDRLAHVGWHPQRQTGRSYVGVVLPVGRMTTDQARRIADIADQYGNGEIRLTVWQNLIIPHIRNEDIDAVHQAIVAMGLDDQSTSFRAGLVACTGSAGCKFAASNTKRDAMVIAAALEAKFVLDQPINIHVTGCHNSCAQHYIGDIGLKGAQVEVDDDMVEGYELHLGGGWGSNQAIGRSLFPPMPTEQIVATIVSIVGGYLERRQDSETFAEFSRRSSDDELRSLAAAGMSPADQQTVAT
ncbi:Sulfite reductase [ferredoxin] [Rubripirellula lacrimiformis]|uniref:Sulfite reductase [ferredoxin] n=1 Tax=Rubripirellula lacrimiformis TaxID=1930273 RepID=A0A517NLL0_9BACT|nr:NirA family protein [Rubripirellula lacrimiformis]QDT08021.1 Sulfite reductase [ferredoxin] [Rubripirellula lacrimiformis]